MTKINEGRDAEKRIAVVAKSETARDVCGTDTGALHQHADQVVERKLRYSRKQLYGRTRKMRADS